MSSTAEHRLVMIVAMLFLDLENFALGAQFTHLPPLPQQQNHNSFLATNFRPLPPSPNRYHTGMPYTFKNHFWHKQHPAKQTVFGPGTGRWWSGLYNMASTYNPLMALANSPSILSQHPVAMVVVYGFVWLLSIVGLLYLLDALLVYTSTDSSPHPRGDKHLRNLLFNGNRKLPNYSDISNVVESVRKPNRLKEGSTKWVPNKKKKTLTL